MSSISPQPSHLEEADDTGTPPAATGTPPLNKFGSGADLGFSRGGGRIFKKFSKILTTFFFFLGRPN